MRVKFERSLIPADPDLSFENALWETGLRYVAGIDEAGRGALAGPVAAAAVIFPDDVRIAASLKGIRDSKQMTPASRCAWAIRLDGLSIAQAVGFASAQEIDEFGIVPATRLAIRRALTQLSVSPQHLLVDFLNLPECDLPQTPLVKGDMRSLSISAASILAKTARDELLCRLDEEYPGYEFAAHKGYGTLTHRQAIQRLGYSAIHRRSFKIKINEVLGSI